MEEAEWRMLVYKIWNDPLTRYSFVSVLFLSSLLAVLFSLISGLLVLTAYISGFFIFKSIFSSKPEAPDFLHALGFSSPKTYELSCPLTPRLAFCSVCGDGKCKRHRPAIPPFASQPWLGLDVPLEIDKALEDFLNQALNQFIYTWYRGLSPDEDFVQELRSSVRHAICIFLRRLLKVNIPVLITKKFVPIALCHIEDYLCSIREAERIQQLKQQKQRKTTGKCRDDFAAFDGASGCGLGALEEGALKLLRESGRLHPAARSRELELEFLQKLSSNLLPYLLPPLQLQCKNWCALVRELLSGWVLLPAMDALADPNSINYLLLLAITTTSSGYSGSKDSNQAKKVSLLSNFSSPPQPIARTAVKSALLESLSCILKDQSLLYPFMQFLKKEGAVNVLQFCLDVEEFNRKILNPELDKQEIFNLYQEAWDLYSVYFRIDSPDRIMFTESVVDEMKEVLAGPAEDIVKLRTTTPLYQAYEHAYSLLENTLCPLFHQSEEYYIFLCGQKESAHFNKSGNSSPSLHGSPAKVRSSKKQSEGWGVSKLSSKIQKIRGALRSSPVEGQTVFYMDPGDIGSGDVVDAGDLGEGDFVDEGDDLDCDSDFIEVEESSGRSLEPRDLSAWRVTIPNVQVRRESSGNSTAGAIGGNTRSPGTTFLIHVRRIDVQGEDIPSDCNWTVERKYSDFYLLESKLVEFHGEFPDNHLPPKRVLFGPKGAEFMHSRRPIFEEYLQKLLQMPNLKGSDLLHTFLRSPFDFASSNAGGYLGFGGPPMMVGGMVSELNLGRMIRRTTLPLRLRKERGQHLEPFLAAFISSTSATSNIQVASSTCSSIPSSSHASPSISQVTGNPVVPDISVQRIKSSSSNVGGKFEWTDVSEDGRRMMGRCLTRSIFGDNFGLASDNSDSDFGVGGCKKKTIPFPVMGTVPIKSHPQLSLNSAFDCFLFLAVRVFGAGEFAIRICLTLGVLLKNTFNSFLLWLVDYLLRKGLSTAHITLLIRRLKGVVFTPKDPTSKASALKAESMARRFKEVGPALVARFNSLPFWIRPFVLRIIPGLSVIHSSLQSPPLNKQLAYSLVDVVAQELFPELSQPAGKA
ncbi:sorting nexin-14-like isoform X2 [Hetaerina americana]|uniref:sorting nexin-14-like isoform X2 n=1 Tax=Hetaerina americana TaxID=62018 RepID=UPI003A7F4BBD